MPELISGWLATELEELLGLLPKIQTTHRARSEHARQVAGEGDPAR